MSLAVLISFGAKSDTAAALIGQSGDNVGHVIWPRPQRETHLYVDTERNVWYAMYG